MVQHALIYTVRYVVVAFVLCSEGKELEGAFQMLFFFFALAANCC